MKWRIAKGNLVISGILYGTESIISDETMEEGNLNPAMLEQLKENGSLVTHDPSGYTFGEDDVETYSERGQEEENEEEENEEEEEIEED